MFFPAALALFAAGASAKMIDITVGGANLTFSPEAIFAEVGDQLVFHFMPKNHTVTQVSFADPCSPLPGGFDSGFMPVPANQTGGTFTVTVNDTKPIWVMCKQAEATANSHCGAGMIFSANCPADPAPNSFDNFKKAALGIGAQLKAAAASASAAAPPAASSAAAYPAASSAAAYPAAPTDAAAPMPMYSMYPGSWSTVTVGTATVMVPPAPTVATVTATVTGASSVYTTTYASYPNSPAPTQNAVPNVTVVQVGASNQLVFNPPRVSAQIGDIIQFQFVSKNHSVVQSSFGAPCVKSVDNTTGNALFNTNFQFVGNSTNFITMNFTVNSTAPLWFYCSQRIPADHCGAGMVFAINSDESGPRNFSTFQTIAKTINGSAQADTTSSASPSGASGSPSGSASSPSPSNGAGVARVGATAILGAVAFVFAALL